ncbi:type II secretion system protein [Patescibacteria group bacterium]
MPKNKKRGFTLIELLVVIGVIGLLASIALIPLTDARNKAKDSEIKTSLSQVRFEASKIYGELRSYSALCASDSLCDDVGNCAGNNYTSLLKVLEDDIAAQNSSNLCYADVGSFCVSAPLNLGGYACVDSKGVLKISVSECSGVGSTCP